MLCQLSHRGPHHLRGRVKDGSGKAVQGTLLWGERCPAASTRAPAVGLLNLYMTRAKEDYPHDMQQMLCSNAWPRPKPSYRPRPTLEICFTFPVSLYSIYYNIYIYIFPPLHPSPLTPPLLPPLSHPTPSVLCSQTLLADWLVLGR